MYTKYFPDMALSVASFIFTMVITNSGLAIEADQLSKAQQMSTVIYGSRATDRRLSEEISGGKSNFPGFNSLLDQHRTLSTLKSPPADDVRSPVIDVPLDADFYPTLTTDITPHFVRTKYIENPHLSVTSRGYHQEMAYDQRPEYSTNIANDVHRWNRYRNKIKPM